MQINSSEVGEGEFIAFKVMRLLQKGVSTPLLTIRASLFSFRLSIEIPLTYSLRFLLLATISSLALSFLLHSIVAIIASHYGDALS